MVDGGGDTLTALARLIAKRLARPAGSFDQRLPDAHAVEDVIRNTLRELTGFLSLRIADGL